MTTQSASPHARSSIGRLAPKGLGVPVGSAASASIARLLRPARERTRVLRVSDLIDQKLFERFLARTISGMSRSYAAVSISVESVPLQSIQPLSRVAEVDRYDTAERLVRLMRRRRYRLFEPTLLRFRGERSFRLVVPPVVEETEDGLVVVDGVHRLTVLADRRIRPKEVQVVVVRHPHPSRSWAVPADLSAVRVRDYDPPRQRKFRRLKEERFRPAGKILRSRRFRFDTPERFVATCDRMARTNRIDRTLD